MKPTLRFAATSLVGLVLGLACWGASGVASAQAPAGQTAPSAAEAPTGLPANIPLRREADAPSAFGGQWAIAAWGLLVLGGAGWVWVRRRQASPAERQRSPWAGWLGAAIGSGKASSTHAPQLLAQTRLTPRHSLHTVQWHGVQYLIACSDHGTQVVAQHPGDAPPAPSKGNA